MECGRSSAGNSRAEDGDGALRTNLQDHPLLPISYLNDQRSPFGADTLEEVALYQEGRGPLSAIIAEGF
jgi:hypothetical protein